MGTPDFAVPSLKALFDSGEEIIAVVTRPDRLKGRGHRLSQPPVKEWALSKGIPVIQPAGIRSALFYEELAGLRPDVIAVVAYGKIIPPAILGLPPLGCINVHASVLPKYRGAAPIQWAIIKGEKKTGVTTMLLDEGLDTGDMLLTDETEILEEDDADTLGRRLSEMGASLLIRTLKGLQDGSIRPVPQTGEPGYAPPLKKEDGRINWSMCAREIFNLIRGTYPWPGAYCYGHEEKITVLKARVESDGDAPAPGRIAKVLQNEFHIGTGRGVLSVIEVKPEGKKAMAASAFLRGRHIKEGESFETA